ncbi:ABC transporter [Candidatus Atribacteria bacterium HGW-Atribacteria-1]|nr:MAG: ABC transporter [Candidatus Atribacteria bacterium HGW-Atribacteria-1]
MNDINKKIYSYYYVLPAFLIFLVFFIIPTIASFFFSFTKWTLFDWEFCGFDNFINFFYIASLKGSIINSFIYALSTSGLKVVLGLLIAVFLCGKIKVKNYLRAVIFYPSILSIIAVGAIFKSLMNPVYGPINQLLGAIGINGPYWLGNPNLALYSIILVDVWIGIGKATLIYIAGLMSIPNSYYEACEIDGGGRLQKFFHITLYLVRPAMNTVIILSFIGGFRTFSLIWAMTGGGPGFTTDVIASAVYKKYLDGLFGLSAAGNVIFFILISILAFPLYKFLSQTEVEY